MLRKTIWNCAIHAHGMRIKAQPNFISLSAIWFFIARLLMPLDLRYLVYTFLRLERSTKHSSAVANNPIFAVVDVGSLLSFCIITFSLNGELSTVLIPSAWPTMLFCVVNATCCNGECTVFAVASSAVADVTENVHTNSNAADIFNMINSRFV